MSPLKLKAAFVLTIASFASFAFAERTVPHARESMIAVAKQHGMPSYERTLPNGVKRVYLNVQGHHIPAIENELAKGSDVVEIMHVDVANNNHTKAVFDRELLHSQFKTTTGHWRLRQWGDRLRPGNKMWSAMIQLTPSEAQRMRTRLANAKAEEGDEANAGVGWELGHMTHGGALGVNGINCVATWCDMPIGDKGETLHELVGLRSYSGDPRGFQLALENQANDRVFGIADYGPAEPTFTNDQTTDKTFK